MGSKYVVWVRKYRLWLILAALVIIAIIAIRPMFWLGSIGFGWVIFWLVVAVGILATYAWVSHNTKSFVKSFLATSLFVILVVGIIVAGILLYISVPALTAYEVKTIINYQYPGRAKALSAEYRGGGIWRVRLIGIGGVGYFNLDETGYLEIESTTEGASENFYDTWKKEQGIK